MTRSKPFAFLLSFFLFGIAWWDCVPTGLSFICFGTF